MESCFQPTRKRYCYSKSNGRKHPRDEDRISSLPDELLLIILSFLTVKQIVNTSVLSSRWFDLWINSHVLDFQLPFVCKNKTGGSATSTDQMECKNYVESVNLVLRRHKSPYLKIFKTALHLKRGYQTDIDTWLEFALARKVEILELNFVYSDCIPYYGICNYIFPDHALRFDLTCLKSLSLRHVDVAGDAVNFILLNCPFLERLVLVDNRKLVDLVISCPSLVLKYLHIKRCFYFKVLRISNLKQLVSLHACSQDLFLSDLPLLVELSLVFQLYDKIIPLFSRVASYLPLLESLTLEASSLQDLNRLPNLAQLKKLKRLVINATDFLYITTCLTPTPLLFFMKSCRNLEEVVLELTWFYPMRFERIMCVVECFDISTSWSSSSLKVFEFKGYFGRESDFAILIHVVKNAPNIEKIIIKAHDLILRSQNRPEDINEKESRNFALKQIGALRKSKFIPPHIDVIIC